MSLLICRCLLLSVLLLTVPALRAADEVDKASAAVTSILFESSADEFTTYVIKDDGWVDIIFARNTPDDVYSAILAKLQSHPDIKGVLAGRGGPTCALF
jgi:hypothetical protein